MELQKTVIEDPRYLGLHKGDRSKVGFHVSFKNTPMISDLRSLVYDL